MYSLTPKHKKINNWAIIHYMGSYRAVTNEQATRERNLYGYDIVHRDLSTSLADEWLTAYRTAQTPVLDNLFLYDFSDEAETRVLDGVQEYDVIHAQCLDGIYRTGSVLAWNEINVWMEVGNEVYSADSETAELIVKADDANWGEDEPETWDVEYLEWLDEIEEDYDFSTSPTVAA